MSNLNIGATAGHEVGRRYELENAENTPVAAIHEQVLANVSQNSEAESIISAVQNRKDVALLKYAECKSFVRCLDFLSDKGFLYSVYDGDISYINECTSLIDDLPAEDRVDAIFEMIDEIDCTLYRAIDGNRSSTIKAYGAVLALLPREDQVNVIANRTIEYAEYLRDAVESNKNRALNAYFGLMSCMPKEQAINLLNYIGLKCA